jgi:hypothetical protein
MSEIVECPKCEQKLQVPREHLGRKVECPKCQHRFTAAQTGVSEQPTQGATQSPPPPKSGEYSEDRPRRRDPDDEHDDRPRRRRDDYGDDDDFDEFPNVRRRQHYAPHRGGAILTMGIVSLLGLLFCGPLTILGPIAAVMGTIDLRAMREGRMDPAGAGTTRAGQVCGIVTTVLMLLLVGFIIFVVVSGK